MYGVVGSVTIHNRKRRPSPLTGVGTDRNPAVEPPRSFLQRESPLMAHFDQLCVALECLLLGAEPTFVGEDRASTAGLFIATTDRCNGDVASNAERREMVCGLR